MPADPKRVKDLFMVVADSPPDARASQLERECAGDAELRQRVEALLAAHDGPDSFLKQSSQGTTVLRPPIGLEVGQVFAGRYKLREKLGEGGMGVVFVADQTEPVQRRVALKVIRDGADSARLLARFEQERQALALMDHPNIAKVFDAGVSESGLPYFVMELIKGVPLTDYCDEAKLNPRERLELFVPICHAVQHAHQKGIIHRDLKPSNILVGLYDGKPVPKVIDFGVAKATGQQLTERSIYTEVGSVIGTLEYMSPEQAELNNIDIDSRSDIYALGAILYQLLTGTVPFSRKELQAGGFAEMLRLIKEKEPPKPSTRLSTSRELPSVAARRQTEPARLSNLVRGELDWIVMKCLEKDRNRRYETANALAKDVQRHLCGDPIEAAPPTWGYRLRKLYRKNRAAILTASTFAVLLLVATAVSLAFGIIAKRAEQEAERRQIQANASAAEASRERDESFRLQKGLAEERDRANAARLETRHSHYAMTMSLIQNAWDTGQPAPIEELLDSARPTQGDEDLRGIEWHFWRRRLNPEVTTVQLGIPYGRRTGCFLSPDGEHATVFSPQYRPANIWDTRTGKRHFVDSTVPSFDHTPPVFSPDGKRVLMLVPQIVPNPKVEDRRFETRLTIRRVPDGKLLAELDGAIGFLLRMERRDQPCQLYAFSPDGTRIAVVTSDPDRSSGQVQSGRAKSGSRVQIHDAVSGKQLFVLALPGVSADSESLIKHSPVHLAFRPDSKELAVFSVTKYDSAITLVDTSTGQVRRRIERKRELLGSLAYSPDGKTIAACTRKLSPTGDLGGFGNFATVDPGIAVIDSDTGAESGFIRCPLGRKVVFSPDGGRVAVLNSASERRSFVQPDFEIYDVITGELLPVAAKHGGMTTDIAFVENKRILAAYADHSVRLWELERGSRCAIKEPIIHFVSTTSIAFGPDGFRRAHFRSAGFNGGHDVQIVDEKNREVCAFSTTGRIGAAATSFSPDGQRLATFSSSEYLEIWNAATGQLLTRVNLVRPEASRQGLGVFSVPHGPVCWSGDGRRIAIDTGHNLAVVFDANSGRERCRIAVRSQNRHGIALNEDGTRLIASPPPDNEEKQSKRNSTSVVIWDTNSEQQVQSISAAHESLSVLLNERNHPLWHVVSPDGRWCAVAICKSIGSDFGTEHSVILIDLSGRIPQRKLSGSFKSCQTLFFTRDSRRLIAGGSVMPTESDSKKGQLRGELKCWNVETGQTMLSLPIPGQILCAQTNAEGNQILAAWQEHDHVAGRSSLVTESWDLRPFSPEEQGRQFLQHLIALRQSKSPWDQSFDGTKSELIDLIRAEPNLAKPVRQAALVIGMELEENPDPYYWACLKIVLRPDHSPEEYRTALAHAEKAVQYGRHQSRYIDALGIAQYRCGMYREAAENLKQAIDTGEFASLEQIAALAMTHYQLGNPDEARKLLEQGWQVAERRNATKVDRAKLKPSYPALVEAEALIEPKKP